MCSYFKICIIRGYKVLAICCVELAVVLGENDGVVVSWQMGILLSQSIWVKSGKSAAKSGRTLGAKSTHSEMDINCQTISVMTNSLKPSLT